KDAQAVRAPPRSVVGLSGTAHHADRIAHLLAEGARRHARSVDHGASQASRRCPAPDLEGPARHRAARPHRGAAVPRAGVAIVMSSVNRLLLIIPAAIVAGLAGGLLVPVIGDVGYRGAVFTAGILAAASCFRASRCFDASERLHGAWLVTGIGYSIIGGAEVFPFRTPSGAFAVLYVGLTIAVNVLGVIGM